MVLILLISFILRIINLNQSLWLDEGITALAVKNYDFLGIITTFARSDFHPPLYYLILKAWSLFFGYSEIALRLPSVIFGVLTVYFVYKIGGKKWGAIAGLFMAVNPLAVYYSQEARMYSLAAFAVAASVWFFGQKKWFWWGLFFLIGLYSDYLVWFMLPVFALFRRRCLIILFFLTPLFFLLKEQLFVGLQTAIANPLWSQVVGGVDPKAVPMVLVKFVFGRISIGWLATISIVYLWFLSNAKNKLHWLWLGLPIILGFLISFKIPVFSYFRFLFVLPAFVLLLAEGVKRNIIFITFIIFIGVISLIIFNLNPRFQRENWRGVAQYVDSHSVFMPSKAQDAALKYYVPQAAVYDRDSMVIGQENTVFLLRYVQEIFDERDFLRKVLEVSGYKKTEERTFNGVVVWKYQL